MGRERYTPQQQEFYRNYLKSPAWKARKAARIRKAGNQCEFVTTHYKTDGKQELRCTRTRYLCVHHNTYERLGQEADKDLDVLCWFHHMIEHLLWKICRICGQPCLGYDAMAELWLSATLAQMDIDLDSGRIDWMALPTKEQLADQIHAVCTRCRGITFSEKDDAT
jgi:hypothetical protein